MPSINKMCACGHQHRLESGWTEYGNRDHKEHSDCQCNSYIAPSKHDKFVIEHAKHQQLLLTAKEQLKIARELERLHAERLLHCRTCQVCRRIYIDGETEQQPSAK